MQTSKLPRLAALVLTLGALASLPSARSDSSAIAQDCAQRVNAIARQSAATISDLGDGGAALLRELNGKGAPEGLILRTGRAVEKAIFETASVSTRLITEVADECIELLQRLGVEPAVLVRLERMAENGKRRIRETAMFQMLRIEGMLALML